MLVFVRVNVCILMGPKILVEFGNRNLIECKIVTENRNCCWILLMKCMVLLLLQGETWDIARKQSQDL